MSLGPYQFWENPDFGSSQRYDFPYPQGTAARDSNSVPDSPRDFTTVPCFAYANKFLSLGDYVYPMIGEYKKIGLATRLMNRGLALVGVNREDLENLPSNPYRFEPMESRGLVLDL
jgi:hypothetical protein